MTFMMGWDMVRFPTLVLNANKARKLGSTRDVFNRSNFVLGLICVKMLSSVAIEWSVSVDGPFLGPVQTIISNHQSRCANPFGIG